jgi:hypothetical protein
MTDYVPFLMWGVGGACTLIGYNIKLLWDIRDHLAKLNGKVGTCDALRQAHERDDDRKHDDCEKRVEKIEVKLMGAS